MFHCSQVLLEGAHARLPFFLAWRRLRSRPVSLRPRRRNVLRIASELQDVPLRKAHMFEQHPGSVWEVRDFHARQLHRPIAHGAIETDVSPAIPEKVEQVFTQAFVLWIGRPDALLGDALLRSAFLLHNSSCRLD